MEAKWWDAKESGSSNVMFDSMGDAVDAGADYFDANTVDLIAVDEDEIVRNYPPDMTSSASSDSVRRPDPVVMERLIDCDIISMARKVR